MIGMLLGISWWVWAGTVAAGALAGGLIAFFQQKAQSQGGAPAPMDWLLKNQVVASVLSTKQITDWLHSFDREYLKDKQCALSRATPELFRQLGCKAEEGSLDTAHYLYALLMDKEGEMKIHQVQLFNFISLEKHLAEMMSKNQDMVVIDFASEGQGNAPDLQKRPEG